MLVNLWRNIEYRKAREHSFKMKRKKNHFLSRFLAKHIHIKKSLSRSSCLFAFLAIVSLSQADPNVIAWDAGVCCGFHGYNETNVPPDLTKAIAIAAGGSHSLALRNNGTVIAWGNNTYGQTNVPASLSNVVAIAAGYYDSIALKRDGTVAVWGANDFGQTNVPAGLTNIVAVAGSFYDIIVLKSDGTVFAWGGNNYGQTNIPSGLSNVVAVSSGFYDNMVLRNDGTVVAWGYGTANFTVTNVPMDLTNAVAITCSMSQSVEHSLALRNDGTVTTWGYTQASVPTGLTNVFAIGAGGIQWGDSSVSRDLALTSMGTLAGWGGTTNIPANQTNVIAIASGEFHQLALIGTNPPIQSVKIVSPTFSGTNFSVQIPTQSGRIYVLEFKTSLTDAVWTALPLVPGDGHITTLNDTSITSNQRFYRIRRW